MKSKVDEYIDKHANFSSTLTEIRTIFLTTELTETIKWGMPTYTLNNKNIVGFGSFKSHCGIWFFQGGLLKDTKKVLQNAQEGKTQTMRQWRFTANDIVNNKLVLQYINEAIENAKKGLFLKPTKKPLIIPLELQQVFDEDKDLEKVFHNLALTKKREFTEYIASAKRESTKNTRLEKIIPLILDNIGLNDKYRNC